MSTTDLELADAVELLRRVAAALRDVAGPGHDPAMAGIVKAPEMLHAMALAVLGAALAEDPEGAAIAAVALLGVVHEQRGDRRAALGRLAEDMEAAAVNLATQGAALNKPN